MSTHYKLDTIYIIVHTYYVVQWISKFGLPNNIR